MRGDPTRSELQERTAKWEPGLPVEESTHYCPTETRQGGSCGVNSPSFSSGPPSSLLPVPPSRKPEARVAQLLQPPRTWGHGEGWRKPKSGPGGVNRISSTPSLKTFPHPKQKKQSTSCLPPRGLRGSGRRYTLQRTGTG